MGIDIYSRWKGQTKEEVEAQNTGFSTVSGKVGYLREAYHGGPYVTKYFLSECFEPSSGGTAKIPASVLAERLVRAVQLALVRKAIVYGDVDFSGSPEGVKSLNERIKKASKAGEDMEIQLVANMTKRHLNMVEDRMRKRNLSADLMAFADFAELIYRKEKETGELVEITASY